MTENQKLALLAAVFAASTQIEEIKTDLKPSEASQLQTKVLELVEEHGEEQAEEQAETLITVDLKDAVRALFNDVVKGE